MITNHQLIKSIGAANMIKYKVKIDADTIYLQAPSEIDVYRPESRAGTLTFFAIIAQLGIVWRVRLQLDMEECKKITASAAVMLFAEVTRVQLATNDAQAILVTPPKGPMQKAFVKSGLHAGIRPGTTRKLNELLDSDQPFQSGNDPQKSLISIMSVMHKAGLDLTRPQAKVFSRGIQEAMLNVMHHAYRHESSPSSGIGKRWWHACWYDKSKNSMSFIIYDKGQGIPRTLQNSGLPSNCDEDIIEHSMKKGVSCLPDPSRGKGLVDVQNVTNIYKGSILFIASNGGTVIIKDEGKEVIKTASEHSFNGTLLEWIFKLGVSDEEI